MLWNRIGAIGVIGGWSGPLATRTADVADDADALFIVFTGIPVRESAVVGNQLHQAGAVKRPRGR